MKFSGIWLAVLFVQLPNFFLFGQSDAELRISVYFTSGVKKNPTDKKRALVSEPNVISLLARYKLINDDVRPSFPDFEEADTVDAAVGESSRQMNRAKVFSIKARDKESRQRLLEELNKMPEVLFAEADGMTSLDLVPNDTRFVDQWNMRNQAVPGADIHAVPAWDITTGNANAIIAIIDNGVNTLHNDLNAKILGGTTTFEVITDANGVQFSHGTHVAGIAAASANNATGVSGVDWRARIHPRNVINAFSTDADVSQAIIDAVNYNANVWTLNNSWSLTSTDDNGFPAPGRYSTIVRQAFAHAYRNNRVSCVAMGNHQFSPLSIPANRYANVIAYPAGFNSGQLAVGATDANDNITQFSANGAHIDVSAPGLDVLSTNLNNGYIDLSGTSMATPHVSGLASLLKGYRTVLANDDIEQIIRMTADDRGAVGFDNAFGTGRINADRALRLVRDNRIQQWSATGGTIFSSTASATKTFLGVPGLMDGTYTVKRHEVRKTVTFPVAMCTLAGAWGRGVGTSGYREEFNRVFGEGICEIVGASTRTSATFRTWIYEVWTTSGQSLGFFPASAANVVFQYTVLGNPVPSAIQGNDLVCTSSTYLINDIPPGSALTWSSSSTTIATVGTGNPATVTKVASGFITLTGTINNTCGGTANYSVTKNLTIGSPPIRPVTTDIEPCGYYVTATTTTVSGASKYLWSLDGAIMQTPTAFINVPASPALAGQPSFPLPAGTHTLQVKVQNTCGTSAYPIKPPPFTFTTSTCTPALSAQQSSSGYSLLISPNPASTSVAVELVANAEVSSTGPAAIQQIRISDKLGNVRRLISYTNGQSKQIVDISFLSADVYVMSAYNGNSWISDQLVVQ